MKIRKLWSVAVVVGVATGLWNGGAAEAAITITDGPSTPAYPGGSPDPWVVPGTLTPNGTLTVDGASAVQADTLALGGRAVVEDTAKLTVDSLDFLGTDDGGTLRSDLFISGGSVNVGQLATRDDATAFLKVSNDGTFTVDAAGGIAGDRSTEVISLSGGGSFEATGNQTFGGEMSSFSLGPGAGSGDVVMAKAMVADTALQIIRGVIDGPPLVGVGSNTSFSVDGDADLGGSNSDALLTLNDGSSFEVTGDLDGLGTAGDFNCFVVDSTFTVGGRATWVRDGDSSATTFVHGSTLSFGGDWDLLDGELSQGGINVVSTTISDSTISVGGDFDLAVSGGSVSPTTIVNSEFRITDDLRVGGPDADNSAVSFTAGENSVIDLGGDFVVELGSESIMELDLDQSTVSTGGDLLVTAQNTDGVTITNLFADCSFTIGGSVVLDSSGGERGRTTISMENPVFDVTGDLRFKFGASGGANRDTNFFVENPTGSIMRDWRIDFTETAEHVAVMAIADVALAVGNDVILEFAGGSDSTTTAFATNLDLTVGQDFVFGTSGGDRAEIIQTIDSFKLQTERDASFLGGVPFATETRRLTGLDFTVGRDLVFAGSQKFVNADPDPRGVVDSVFRVAGNTRIGEEGGATSLEMLASNSQIAGGGLQTPAGTGTATSLTLAGLIFDLDDRVTFGGPTTFGSALSAVLDGVTLDTELDIDAQLGMNSVANFELSDCPIVAGTGMSVVNGNSSTLTYSQVNGSLTSGGSVSFDSSNAELASTVITMEEIPFDIADDFRISACAAGSDSLILMQRITGQVGGDYLFEVGGRAGEISNVVLIEHQLSIGGNAKFMRPGGAGGSQTFFAGGLNLGIGGDLEFGPDHVATVVDSRFAIEGAAMIAGEMIAGDVEIAGVLTVSPGGTLIPELAIARVGPTEVGVQANSDLNFTGGSNLKVALVSEGTAMPYITASSGVDLGGANLSVSLGENFNPAPGTVFTLISKDGSDPVSGTFAGLPEGATIALGTDSCFGNFRISYGGGDGDGVDSNDVTLTVLETSNAGATVAVEGDPVLNPQTDYFEQRVTVTNTCSTAIESFRLLIDVPADVTVANRSGTIGDAAFVQGGALAAGASITFTVEFFRVDRDPDIAPEYSVQITSGPPPLPAAATGPAGAPARVVGKANGDVLVEFDTVPGKLYEFQYGSTPAMFKAVTPQFRAVADRTQFLDNGAPKTESHPRDVDARYYRIVEVELVED